MTLVELAEHLRSTLGVLHKQDIDSVRKRLLGSGHPEARIGDDCAAIPNGDGFTLVAIEGMLPRFVQREPWFAGYSSVMVNVSDIYAMGGRPTAVVDALWTGNESDPSALWQGILTACQRYAVPLVGGHTNSRDPSGNHLAVAIVGTARRLLTSFDARSDDVLIAAIDLRGEWFGDNPFWNASTAAPAERLRGDLEIMPMLAESGLCMAAKDISMAGVIGTALMLAECSNVGFTIDISQIPKPTDVILEKWLTAFPSFGFILSVSTANVSRVLQAFIARNIAAAAIGRCTSDGRCMLHDESGDSLFWDLDKQPLMGFGSRL